MSTNINVWVSDETKGKLDELVENNKNGYSDEFLANDKITRFRNVLTRTSMSGLAGELLQLGLMVFENNMKDASGKHKVDMTEYYEKLLYDVAVCKRLLEQATEVSDFDTSDIQKQMNRLFRGSADKFE